MKTLQKNIIKGIVNGMLKRGDSVTVENVIKNILHDASQLHNLKDNTDFQDFACESLENQLIKS